MSLTKEELSLLELQEIDIKLGQINEKLEKAPFKQRIVATRAKITEGEKRIELIEAARTDLEKKVSVLQDEVDFISERMKAHQELMQNSSDHREVETISKELESLMKQREKSENQGMNLMEKRSEFGTAQQDTADKTNQLKEIEARELEAYKKYFNELKAVHDALTTQRNALLPEIGKENLLRYENIRTTKHGVGVALYSEGKCGACQVSVPEAQRAEMEAAGGIVTCPSCKRLLIVEK